MNSIKKATITVGTVIGGAIGGTMQVAGKITGAKFLDNLGESIVDSTIYTGTIAGEIISGGAEIAVGKITKNSDMKSQGKTNLKSGSSKIVNNFTGNVKLIAKDGGEIVKGAVTLDGKLIVRSTKRLVKVAAIGTITVGAIKLADDNDDPHICDSTVNENAQDVIKKTKGRKRKIKRIKKGKTSE